MPALNERPIWRYRLMGLPTADHIAHPTQFWHPVQNLAPGRHVDLISPIGPERALLWRRPPRGVELR